ncbi:ATP-dependent RecD-like DNA helicase [Bacteriophage DSS3_MAL1]|nr:ATP-dependent RecD-like DNA helicase [Bacteriophage DSS3_MAL1]
MTPTLTDHQWGAVKLAADWYSVADANRYQFEMFQFDEDAASFARGDRQRTMLGQGQDFFFGGFAGTGKTTVLPAVIESFGLTPEQVAFCAPTGKAAKVMGEKLRAFGMNVMPTTIHKLIYLPKRAHADRIQAQIDNLGSQIVKVKMGEQDGVFWDGDLLSVAETEATIQQLNFDLIRAMDNNDGPQFQLRPLADFPEDVKLIVVDEGSMVGKTLAEDLATFGRPILAFGDPGQLPPVGDIYGFECEQPDAFLTEIHRQAKDNPIIQLATMAREGKELRIGDYGNGVKVVDRRNDDVTLDMDRDAMVLCGTHKKRWTLTKKIRNASGYTETGPCEGEPLLFCKNSQKLEAMVNGTIVTCMTEIGDLTKGNAVLDLKIRDDDGGGAIYDIKCAQGLFEEHHMRKRNAYTANSNAAFKAKRENEHVDWGHVLTVHKSQGSQWDDVVVHDESGAFRDASSRWLYTAVTRAAKHLTVVV